MFLHVVLAREVQLVWNKAVSGYFPSTGRIALNLIGHLQR